MTQKAEIFVQIVFGDNINSKSEEFDIIIILGQNLVLFKISACRFFC